MSKSVYPEWIDHFYGDLVGQRGVLFRPSFRDFQRIVQFWEYAPEQQRARLCIALYEMPYRQFLGTFYWHAVKAKVIHDRGGLCSECRKAGEVDVHHLSYYNHGREHLYLADLAVLCRNCHEKAHAMTQFSRDLIYEAGKGKRL